MGAPMAGGLSPVSRSIPRSRTWSRCGPAIRKVA